MKLSQFISIAFIGAAAAAPCGPESDNHKYHAPLRDDVRSPCPGLNVLSNHGFLPRSGKNIDLPTLRQAVSLAYNYHPNSFDSAFQEAVDFHLTTTGNASTFNLNDLKLHDAIEMDGSLSRDDFYFGDANHFDPEIWAGVAENMKLYDAGSCERDRFVTIETAAKARALRVQDAMARNPTFNASKAQMRGSPGTVALALTTLWDYEADAAPKAWIKAFFEEERIPWLEGYKQPIQRNLSDVGAMTERLVAVNLTELA
ncbi:Chloroperoxidase [Aspergillus karnatakaensis]|uniref:peroxidase family protein n=1 Tax=Aspergillus karnatakaensis TaxID=1810916 RepID=UPI003CCC911B